MRRPAASGWPSSTATSKSEAAAPTLRLALIGDTMLGRNVAEAARSTPPESLVSAEVADAVRGADLCVLNLECCISARGSRWPNPRKPYFFRAPPVTTALLRHLGVDCVTLANNHALDYGDEALLDTLDHLRDAGIAWVGAGTDVETARRPAVLDAAGFRLGVLGLSDHPAEFAARPDAPGIAFDSLEGGRLPAWLTDAIAGLDADAVLVTPHWGPNMASEPLPRVRAAAAALLQAGATLVAGHSAHVFQGVQGRVLYDLGDFIDDYAVDGDLRNDLGLLFLIDLDERGPVRLECVPLKLEYCRTTLAQGKEASWVRHRFRAACAALETVVAEQGDRLVVSLLA